jgi:hypothetical protein
MKGWQIFMHSLRQVFGNFSGALLVSAVPYLAMTAVVAFFVIRTASNVNLMDEAELRAAMEAGEYPVGRMIFGGLVSGLVATVCALWIVVGWHRYVLLNEQPVTVPRFDGAHIWAYFRRSLWIAILMIPALVVFALLLAGLAPVFLSDPGPGGMAVAERRFSVIVSLLLIPLSMIALRLSAALPGSALGAPVSVGDAWRATKGESGAFLTLAVLFAAVSYGSGLVGSVVSGSLVLSLLWQFGFGWVSMMVGASVLTTLYGHYIEKRPLV